MPKIPQSLVWETWCCVTANASRPVLVAEDITSRFLNVVSLFNGALPIMAIQMQAYEVGEHITLVFTKVLDEMQRGLVDEDEDAISAPTDRAYWEREKGTPRRSLLWTGFLIW